MSGGNEYQLQRCQEHADIWKSIEANNPVEVVKTSTIRVFSSVLEAVEFISHHSKCDVLFTGSLHLVGSALSVIQEKDPQKIHVSL